MSDAMTDISRDRQRYSTFVDLTENLAEYLKDPNETNFNSVIKTCKEMDEIPSGYFGGTTSYATYIEKQLTLLKDKDRQAWIQILHKTYNTPYHQRLKNLSPFKDQIMIIINYGRGFANIEGEIQSVFDKIIYDEKYKAYDCDKYAVFIPKNSFENAEVEWYDCGILGVNGPRTYDENQKKWIVQKK